jgi:hypothetical protein
MGEEKRYVPSLSNLYENEVLGCISPDSTTFLFSMLAKKTRSGFRGSSS